MMAVNRIYALLLMGFFSMGMMVFSSCSKENPLEVAQNDVRGKLTTAPWGDPGVTRNGLDVSDDYVGFQLEFKNDTYRTINGGAAWPASGTWKFVDGKSDQILRDAGTDNETIVTITTTDIDLSADFTVNEDVFSQGSSGRTMVAQAQFVFTMSILRTDFGG